MGGVKIEALRGWVWEGVSPSPLGEESGEGAVHFFASKSYVMHSDNLLK